VFERFPKPFFSGCLIVSYYICFQVSSPLKLSKAFSSVLSTHVCILILLFYGYNFMSSLKIIILVFKKEYLCTTLCLFYFSVLSDNKSFT
jgi:hypothetical protein